MWTPCRSAARTSPPTSRKSLSAPLGAAERIKTLYGSALATTDSGADLIDVPLMGESAERGIDRVRRSQLTAVIQARLEEILDEAQSRLKKSGFDVAAGRRAVLTGGGSQLPGVREVAARVTGKQVRIGTAAGVPRDRRGGHRTGLCDGTRAPDRRRDQSAGNERSKSSGGGEDGAARPCHAGCRRVCSDEKCG